VRQLEIKVLNIIDARCNHEVSSSTSSKKVIWNLVAGARRISVSIKLLLLLLL